MRVCRIARARSGSRRLVALMCPHGRRGQSRTAPPQPPPVVAAGQGGRQWRTEPIRRWSAVECKDIAAAVAQTTVSYLYFVVALGFCCLQRTWPSCGRMPGPPPTPKSSSVHSRPLAPANVKCKVVRLTLRVQSVEYHKFDALRAHLPWTPRNKQTRPHQPSRQPSRTHPHQSSPYLPCTPTAAPRCGSTPQSIQSAPGRQASHRSEGL